MPIWIFKSWVWIGDGCIILLHCIIIVLKAETGLILHGTHQIEKKRIFNRHTFKWSDSQH